MSNEGKCYKFGQGISIHQYIIFRCMFHICVIQWIPTTSTAAVAAATTKAHPNRLRELCSILLTTCMVSIFECLCVLC